MQVFMSRGSHKKPSISKHFKRLSATPCNMTRHGVDKGDSWGAHALSALAGSAKLRTSTCQTQTERRFAVTKSTAQVG